MTTVLTSQTGEIAAHRTMALGGCTIDPVTLSAPTYGYAVSLPGHEYIVNHLGDANLAWEIAEYITRKRSQLAPVNRFLGTWLHLGSCYLDVTEVVPDLVDAIRLAESRDQLAIYDLARRVEIPTSPIVV